MSLVVLKKEDDNILTDIIAKPLFMILERSWRSGEVPKD